MAEDLGPIDQKPTLKELQKYVVHHVAPLWEELGIQLNLDDDGSEVDNISKRRGGDESKCCVDVLKAWLQGKGEEPKTWRTLVDCLREIKAEGTIQSIKENIVRSTVSLSQHTSPSQQQSAGQSSGQEQTHQQEAAVLMAVTPLEPQSLTQPPRQSIDYSLHLKERVRQYQRELAEPGLRGENYIICAPTGTGKTLVAGLIISEHLQKRRRDGNPGKVIFMVTTRPLAQQQKVELNKMMPQASVECCIGEDGSTIELLLKHEDIIVCTAGKLLNELKEDKVHLEEISLVVIDECHHTVKESPQAKVMEIYLEKKQQGKINLPQVVGLTASPGAGDNPTIDWEKALHHLISLCALMDATSGIKTVTENVDELEQHKNKSTSRLQIPKGREHGEEFVSRITKEMADLEQLVSLRCPFPRWSQQYETSIQQKKQPLEMSLNPEDRDQINVLKFTNFVSEEKLQALRRSFSKGWNT